MTVPHDEQPLTRRQLRDLERQKPRKQQKEEAKAAEEAEAKRRADEAARAAAERAEFEADAARAVNGTPVVEPPVEAAPVEAAPIEGAPVDAAPSDAEVAPVEDAPAPVAPVEDAPVQVAPVQVAPVEVAPAEVAPAEEPPLVEEPTPAETVAPAPILSRRARRALSADHPLAEQPPVPVPDVEPEPLAEATGPIIAEIVHDDEPVEEDVLTVESEHVEATDDGSADAAVPMVEELMVVDEYVSPEVQAEEAEELAEIDDTPEPEPVHIVTIEETPSAPILAPMFQAAAAPEKPANTVDLTRASFDDLIASRGVGASNSVASTSALVLPSVPNHGDVGTALDETGEVIITGSIDLPMSLGSTGAAPADGLESSELDAFLDPESEVGSDVAPVSATRAISTHGPSSGLVAPPKRRGANAPVILAVTAGVLAVGVVGLLLAAFVFRIF
ncbi:hypothetical protein [Subtercola endophyticus]|uniref:hypothetical protein n=1 Tax=Subtercola endophyticus TaxID=2895559 RepID=UPI001E65D30A|nr:hypothetical protein [Subtercola endophyticus]UFS60847.1 hypothetical protein LQ955_08965 [Subtercola endophyticus]